MESRKCVDQTERRLGSDQSFQAKVSLAKLCVRVKVYPLCVTLADPDESCTESRFLFWFVNIINILQEGAENYKLYYNLPSL